MDTIDDTTSLSRGPLTVDAFLRWEDGGEFRWELVTGEPTKLPRDGTRDHMRLIMNLSFQLASKLNSARFVIATSCFAVKTPTGVRMPDLVVDTADGSGSDLTATSPILIAEVSSEESRERDLGEKRADYQGVESLRHYLVLMHDSREVLHWQRKPSGGWQGPVKQRGEPFYLSELDVTVSGIWAAA